MIQCQYKAVEAFIKSLTKGVVLKDYNKGRHKLIRSEEGLFYMIYKRNWFNSFSEKFPDFKCDCVGESINKKSLGTAIYNNVDKLVFVHPDGVYSQYPLVIERFCEVNKLVRIQDKSNSYAAYGGNRKEVREETYSFPKYLLEKH